MTKKKRNKLRLLFYGPLIGGLLLWYFVFASITAQIIVPWIIALALFIKWKIKKTAATNEVKIRKIKRYD